MGTSNISHFAAGEKETGDDAWHCQVAHHGQKWGLKTVLLNLEQWFPPRGNSVPQRIFGNEHKQFCLSQLRV